MTHVVYGTSDWFLNYGEVLLTQWVGERENLKPRFFLYPKGFRWLPWEQGLFEPYALPPSLDPASQAREAGIDGVEFLPLQLMVSPAVDHLKLQEVVEAVRRYRDHKAFVVVNLVEEGELIQVHASSKDKNYNKRFSQLTLGELAENPEVKLGGSIIYFLYGAYLASFPQLVGILPRKLNGDVIGAFRAGEEIVGGKARIIVTGEIDLMTATQWQLWREDKKWKKAPPWVVRKLLENHPKFCRALRERLLSEQYCPVAYDEIEDHFYFWEEV